MSAVLKAREPQAQHLGALEPKLVRQFDLLVGASAGVTRLREFILALAMQGKLLSQDPTDEPADKLVRRLMAERGESSLRRRTAASTGGYPVGEDSDVLPSSWMAATLSAISVKLTDGSHNPPHDVGSGIPMLSSQNILESGTIDFDSPTRYVSVDDFERENVRTNATPGDVLLTIVASLGRSAVVPVDAPAFVLQRSVAVIRTGLVPSFLAMFLRSPAARAYYDEHGKGTAQKGIYLGKLGELTVPIPPLAEQSRIVARVDELMRLCDALEAKGRLEAEQHARLLGTLLGTLTDSSTPEEMAESWQRVADHFDLLLDRPEAVDALEQTILQLAVRGLLVSQDPSQEPGVKNSHRSLSTAEEPIDENELPFDVPANWRWVRLGSQAELINGDRGKNYPNRAEYVVTGVPFINTGHIEPDGTLSHDSMHHLSRAKFESLRSGKTRPGDLVYCLRGATLGKTAIVEYPEGAIASSLVILRFKESVNRRFAYLFLTSPLGRDLIRRFDNGSAQPNLAASSVARYVMPLPPVEEQSRIVTRVTELRRLCADLRQRLTASETTQSQLAEAMVNEVA